jgi:hypothetical protein
MNSVAHDEEELLKLEKEFERAVVSNDAAAEVCWPVTGPSLAQMGALSTDGVFSK